ncbi:MAG: S41 family peptidase [bacterium]|nr:S41 family peptidase [bacterium]
MANLKKYLFIYISLILILASFALGVFLGHSQTIKAPDKGWQVFDWMIKGNSEKPKEVDFDLFWQVWNVVEEKFTNGSLDRQKMIYGAISGMVKSLGDPYTAFMTPSEAAEFDQEMEGKFEGIGAEIGIRNDRLTIVAPLDGSPAKQAGLKARDIILKIDDQETFEMNLLEAISLIRGAKGTEVILKIMREGIQDAFEVKITRAEIIVASVKWSIRDDKIAVVEVSRFGEDTEEKFQQAVVEILLAAPDGLILDLRNNPGGYLETAVDLASEFIPKKEVVAMEEFSGGKRDKFFSRGPSRLAGIPTMVLVNEGSASASEILAGSLQDYNLAKLVGKKTFGKGSVQELEQFSDGSEARITIAKWLTPLGRYIHEKGIDPDFEVDLTSEDTNAGRDPQLDKAVEMLTQQ